MRKSHRIPRLQEELKKLFNLSIQQKLRDPALQWVNITEVLLSKDLRHAKLYFTHYNNPASHEAIREQLTKSSGFFKKQIAGARMMRTIPELTFFYDETEDRAEKVEALLASVKQHYDDDDGAYDPDINLDDYLEEEEEFEINEDEEIYKEFLKEEEKEKKKKKTE